MTTFTVEADRQPILVFAARRHEEAYAFFQSDNFREKMRVATSNGTSLLDQSTILRLRLANREERARFRNTGNTMAAAFLVDLDNE